LTVYYIIPMLNHKLLFCAPLFSLLLTSCGNHSLSDILACTDTDCFFEEKDLISRTGWLQSRENLSNIPQDVSVSNVSSGGLPSSVSDLENRFPPIGDQGQYGTCVAWAAGYNLKTALNGIEKGWNSTELSRTTNQTSPKDLWFTIPSAEKGSNCNGTNFEAALDALIAKGASNLSSVPYTSMGSCSGTSNGNANNKLANYRKIAYNYSLAGGSGSLGLTEDNLKSYLAQGRPILFGAKLGDRFMRWNNASVLSSDTYNDPNMQHAYHAMVLVGYDNSKNAFKVRNSWGSSWGDRGSIWVDYDFFLRNFMFVSFVAQNPTTSVENEVKEDQLIEGYDLSVSDAEDFQDPEDNTPRKRAFYYDVYNSGTRTILASQRWRVFYMYYNAFNADDLEIIYEDYYTDEFGKIGYEDCNYLCGDYSKSNAISGGIWNNMDVKPGKKAGEDVFGSDGFYIPYTMPQINGKYYLVIYADAHDEIKEGNEDNNFYFIGAEGGKPLEFVNGVIKNGIIQNKPAHVSAKKAGKAPATSVQAMGGSANAYTPAEIKTMVLRNKKNGVLAKKIAEYRESVEKPIKKRWSNK